MARGKPLSRESNIAADWPALKNDWSAGFIVGAEYRSRFSGGTDQNELGYISSAVHDVGKYDRRWGAPGNIRNRERSHQKFIPLIYK